MTNWVYIDAVGSTIIASLTIIAGVYLLVALFRQGTGKLRTRLLVGMVISDILIGCAVLPSEVSYITGNAFQTGEARCSAMGFVVICILFTQHLWTLMIAAATFLLLKYPLSRVTVLLERYSWAIAPLIWGISLVHSGIWLHTVGIVSSGSLCYYGGHTIPRDLVQFIPRAFVFVFVVCFYSRLFNFLRRPDTINLSSHLASGTRVASEDRIAIKMIKPLIRLGRGSGNHFVNRPVDPDAPWEQLEFVTVGHDRVVSPITTVTHDAGSQRKPSSVSEPPTESPESLLDSLEGETPATPELRYADVTVNIITSSNSINALSSIMYQDKDEGNDFRGAETDKDVKALEFGGPCDQTLQEFFQQYTQPGTEDRAGGLLIDGKGGMQTSAATYFNRQASLLMLYFPIAYMVVFSISLARLAHDMVSSRSNPLLALLSAWFVLSVGISDALVYGLAEFVVKRRVRKKMPDRI